MQKLKKSLNRLKNDLYVFKLSKKLQKQARGDAKTARASEEAEDES